MDYRLSVPQASDKYQTHYWGITQIENDQFEIFIRPANEIQTGYGTSFFLFIPTNRKIEDGKFHFLESGSYYQDAIEKNERPNKFVIEMYINPKSEKLSFNPKACRLLIDKKVIGVEHYFIVRNDKLGLPPPYKDDRYLFKYEDRVKALETLLSENADYVLKTATGFILEFNCSTPVPGKDTFEFVLDGFSSNGNKIPSMEIDYNQTRDIVRDFDL